MSCSPHDMRGPCRLLRNAMVASLCLFLIMMFIEPSAYSEVKTESFKIATMGSRCYWKIFDDHRIFYGGMFPKENSIEVTYSPEMFLDKSAGSLAVKGMFEYHASELMVMSEKDPNETMRWKNDFLSDDYLAASRFPKISFEIQSITLHKPSETETTNAIVKGILSVMGEKKVLEFPSYIGIGGGYLMATADFELPKNTFVNEATKINNLARKLADKKILIKLKIVAQRRSEPRKR